MKTNQNGFGAVAVLIGLVVVGLVGFGSWYAWSTNQTNPIPAKVATPSPEKADPFLGWKTYTSVAAGYSIKYPATWSLRTGTNKGGTENVTFTSTDNFEITLLSFTKASQYGAESFKMNPTGQCVSICLSSEKVMTVTIPKFGEVEIDAQQQGAGGGSINALVLNTLSKSAYLNSPTKPLMYTTVTGIYQSRNQHVNTDEPLATFTNSSSVKQAEQIYSSLTY